MARSLPEVPQNVWDNLWRKAGGRGTVAVTYQKSVHWDDVSIGLAVQVDGRNHMVAHTLDRRALETADNAEAVLQLLLYVVEQGMRSLARAVSEAGFEQSWVSASLRRNEETTLGIPATVKPAAPSKPPDTPYPAPLGERFELLELHEVPAPARTTAYPATVLPPPAPAPAPEPDLEWQFLLELHETPR